MCLLLFVCCSLFDDVCLLLFVCCPLFDIVCLMVCVRVCWLFVCVVVYLLLNVFCCLIAVDC